MLMPDGTHTLQITNIYNLVSSLNIDLKVVVIDWDEIRELQLAFLKSNVSQQDTPQITLFLLLCINMLLNLVREQSSAVEICLQKPSKYS